MRVGLVFSVVMITLSLPLAAKADDFGPRFFAQTPAGLGDYTAPDTVYVAQDDDIAQELQDIMPAAGEEDTTGTPVPAAAE